MKNVLVWLTVCLLALASFGCAQPTSDELPQYIYGGLPLTFQSAEQLMNNRVSSNIFIAEAEKIETAVLPYENRDDVEHQVTTLRIKQVVNGSLQEGDTLCTVLKEDPNTTFGGGFLKQGKRYLFFCQDPTDLSSVEDAAYYNHCAPLRKMGFTRRCHINVGIGWYELNDDNSFAQDAPVREKVFGDADSLDEVLAVLAPYLEK